MPTYSCKYHDRGTTNANWVEINAESPEEAYEIYVNKVGQQQFEVMVEWGNSITGGAEKFSDHIDQQFESKTRAAKQQAQSSLDPTDMLLKELLAAQNQTNEWLCKIRWALISIGVCIWLIYLFGWVIVPAR